MWRLRTEGWKIAPGNFVADASINIFFEGCGWALTPTGAWSEIPLCQRVIGSAWTALLHFNFCKIHIGREAEIVSMRRAAPVGT